MGIAQRIACPECDGESVYESQSPAAANIRVAVLKLVEQGTYSDDQIIQFIQKQPGCKLAGPDKIRMSAPLPDIAQRVSAIKQFFKRLQ